MSNKDLAYTGCKAE